MPYSGLDYGNALKFGPPKSLLSALQSVQNAAAHLVAKAVYYSKVSNLMLTIFNWLPISDQAEYKQIILAPAALQAQAPSYITELFT